MFSPLNALWYEHRSPYMLLNTERKSHHALQNEGDIHREYGPSLHLKPEAESNSLGADLLLAMISVKFGVYHNIQLYPDTIYE